MNPTRLFSALLGLLVLAGCSSQPPSFIPHAVQTAAHSRTGPTGMIAHVVIVVQENRTPDNLFNGFPGADTVNQCLDHTGLYIPMVEVPLYQKYDLDHSHTGFEVSYDGGLIDRQLNYRNGTGGNRLYACQYTQPSDTVPYWTLASTYAFADRMFSSQNGPSFSAHQFLIAAQSGYNDNPKGTPWGCDNTIQQTCFDYTTLGDLMDANGVTWRYYSDGGNKSINIWQAYDAIRHIRYGTDWTNGDIASAQTTFFANASACTLPEVSWVTPSGPNSDHPGHGSFGTGGVDTGPAWVASIVDAVMGGTCGYNANTAILITWDDWGGWYDHVAPPQLYPDGLGYRVPLIVVSAYAKPAYVSHVQHEFGSILHFTEEQFGLPSLGMRDASSDDLSDMFDFGQAPIAFKHVAHTRFDSVDQSAPDNE